MDPQTERERPTPDAHWIVFSFYPWDEYTTAAVRLESRLGGIGSSTSIWAGRLAIGRRDLVGQSPRECAFLLGDELWCNWHDGDALCQDPAHAVGAAAPLGAAGGTVPQDHLPGL